MDNKKKNRKKKNTQEKNQFTTNNSHMTNPCKIFAGFMVLQFSSDRNYTMFFKIRLFFLFIFILKMTHKFQQRFLHNDKNLDAYHISVNIYYIIDAGMYHGRFERCLGTGRPKSHSELKFIINFYKFILNSFE